MKDTVEKSAGADKVDINDSDRIRQELQRITLEQARPTVLVGLVAFVLCYFLLLPYFPSFDLLWWVMAAVIITAIRWCSMGYVRQHLSTSGNLIPYTALVSLTGALWGALSFYWSPDIPLTAQLVIVTFPLCVSVGAVSSYGTHLPTFFAFVLPAQIPFALQTLFTQDSAYAKLALPAVLFFLAQAVLARALNRNHVESVKLRLTNDHLVAELSEHNLQLADARDEAFAASAAKGDFLARMSHELRTPMNGVLGVASLLQRTRLDERQIELVETLRRSGSSLMALLNDLLDVSQLESGDISLDCSDYSIRELVNVLDVVHRVEAQDKGLQFQHCVDDSVPQWIHGDALRVQQILMNLIDNAIKFTSTGHIDVNVSAYRNEAGTQRLKMVVTDTGDGIDENRLKEIFTLFEQVDGTDTRRYGGTGIGLSIAHGLAATMDGGISVSSEPGEGSTFTVDIAFIAGASPGHFNDASLTSIEVPDKTFNVLVAEDNMVNQMLIESMLESLNCNVTMTEDGQQALDALEWGEYDIIFMDCQMPVLDGLAASKRAREKGFELPIVAVTANAMQGSKERCLRAGMSDFIAKPFDAEHLETVLHRWTGPEAVEAV